MSLTRKAGIVTASRAVSIAAQLLAAAILARSLPKEDFGLVNFLLIAYATVQAFAQLGLPDSVFFFFEKLLPAQRRRLCLLLGRLLLLLGAAGAAALLLAGWLGTSREGFEAGRGLLWVFMLLLLLELPAMPLPNILIALGRARQAAWLNIFIGLSQLAAMALPALLHLPVSAVAFSLLAYGALRLAVSAAVFFHLFKNEPDAPLPAGMVRELFGYALPLSVAQVFWGLNRQVDKFVVQWFLPIAVFAEYSVGAWEIPLVPTIAYSVASVMMPQMVGHHLRGERAALLELWNRSIRKVSALVLPLVMVFLVAAEEFVVSLFSEDYAGAALPFRIYTLILLQRVASYSNMQKALGSTAPITRAAVWLFFLNFGLSIPLVLWLGMAGPPLAALLANTFTWWYSLSKIKELLGVRFREVFPFGFYFKALAVAALAALPVFFLKSWLPLAAPLKLLAVAAGYLALYVFLAKTAGIIAREDWQRMLRAAGIGKAPQ